MYHKLELAEFEFSHTLKFVSHNQLKDNSHSSNSSINLTLASSFTVNIKNEKSDLF